MKKYLSFFRIRFIAGLQYRAAAWAGVATQFAWGGLTILLFRAFYQSGENSFPMEFADLSTYIWLQQSLLAMYMLWFFDNEIFETITSGSIAYELCRPCDLYTMWFVKNMAIRLSKAVLRCLPILAVAVLLPHPYAMSAPAGVGAAVGALVSMVLGFLVLIAFSMLIYISAFYTVSPRGMRILASSLTEFFAGAVIPIPFFPVWLQNMMNALPFAAMQSTPFLIYTGYLEGAQVWQSMAVQLIWLVVLVGVGKLMMNHALKRVVVQGG